MTDQRDELIKKLVEALVVADVGYGDDCADQDGLDIIRQALAEAKQLGYGE